MSYRPTLPRRALMAGAVAAPFLGVATARAQRQDPRVLRYVPQANLASLDPVWTTATVTSNHGYYVYDTLFAQDAQGAFQPQMAEGHSVSADGLTWRITLREGLTFHDGTPVRGVDCAASLRRWSARDGLGQVLAGRVAEWAAPEDRVLEIRLNKPFPLMLAALGKAYAGIPFIMPERIARTDPNTAITEVIGSGPYRFLANEYVSGSRVAYQRFEGYRPRAEAPSWGAGGKVAMVDRIEWHIIPDAATAAAALRTGEVDWWELPQVDLLAALQRDRNIAVRVIDPTGQLVFMRMNSLSGPFANKALRQAIQMAVSQPDWLRASAGQEPDAWRECMSLFPCGTAYETKSGPGLARMQAPRNLDAARAAIRASGYAGERIVVLNPSDFPLIQPLGVVTHDLFRRLGLNSELAESDWGTVVQRRTNREIPERGGWSAFHTFGASGLFANPLVNLLVRGTGERGWPGWYQNAEVEAAVTAWLDAPDEASRRAAADTAGRIAMDEVSTLPLGIVFNRTAFRRSMSPPMEGAAPYPWNIRKTV